MSNLSFLNVEGRIRAGWWTLLFALPWFALSLPAGLVVYAIPTRWLPYLPTPWVDAAVALGATWICLRLEGRPLSSVGLRLNGAFLRASVMGAALGAGVMLLSAGVAWALGAVRWAPAPGVTSRDLTLGLWFYLAVAVHEETLARGFPFQRLVQGLGAPWALSLFAALFALAHWGNPGMRGETRLWATLNIALASLLLGLAYLRTGSLALPMGIHLGWNWTQGSLLGFGVSGTHPVPGLLTPLFTRGPRWLTGGDFGLEASLPCTAACLLAILALGRWKGSARLSGGASTASGS